VAIVGAAVLFLWSATYFMARAMRREADVARLQSDFVAAVSHEFRSPLTTIRQMAEMLEMRRIDDDTRRHRYYSVLAGEAARLQRLVETLLDFGRMEARASGIDPLMWKLFRWSADWPPKSSRRLRCAASAFARAHRTASSTCTETNKR
jgi:signal transduction histidine kinase